MSTACKMALESGAPPPLGAVPQHSPEPSHPGNAGAHDADGDFEAEVVSAFGEAFNNIAVHGFRDLAPEPVHIEVDWDDEKLVITFVDQGRIFDPDSVVPPDLDELPEHGMGLFIIRSCMDSVEYRPGPPNVLRLVKLRTGSRLGIPPPPPTSSEQAVQQTVEQAGAPSWGTAGAREVARANGDVGSDDAEGRGSGVDLISPLSTMGETPEPPPQRSTGAAASPASQAARSRARSPTPRARAAVVLDSTPDERMVESSRRR